jgi:hypothetical protein
LAQNNELLTYINNKEDNKPAKHADLLLNAPANGRVFFRFQRERKNLICSSDATKLGERVEFYSNGKELRSVPRQKSCTCMFAPVFAPLQPNLKQTAGIKPAADTTGGLVAVFGGFIKTAGGSAGFFF